MRRHTVASICAMVAVVAAAPASAQQPPPELPAVDDLRAPPSPAFVLLDVAPSKIERPQAVRALVLSALSALSTDGFPKNYAVEVAPYWLGTPELSFDEYYSSSVAQAIARHLSISVATTPLAGSSESGTSIGIGARTLPLPGRAHPRLQTLLQTLQRLQQETIDEEGFFARRQRLILLLQEAQGTAVAGTDVTLATKPFEDLIDRMIDLEIALKKVAIELDDNAGELAAVRELPPDRQKQREDELKKERAQHEAVHDSLAKQRRELGAKMIEAVRQSDIAQNLATEKQFELLVARYDQAQRARATRRAAALKETALAIQALDTQRVGPLLAVAAAVSWDIPGGETELTTLSKVGFWVTPGYRIARCSGAGQNCATSFDLLGVVRFLDDRRPSGTGDIWELGARFIWQPQTKLAVSAEWLGRSGDDEPGSRLVGVAEYEVTDSVFLYASFGRDFEEAGARQNLVSTIGLTFGLGKKPILN
jgi:hypothetical protein